MKINTITKENLSELREKLELGELGSFEAIREWIDREWGISYTARGVAKLLERELGAQRAWTFDNSSASRPTTAPYFPYWPTMEGMITFLNRLSVTGNLNEDMNNFRTALADFLPEVDRISIFIGLRTEYDRTARQHVIMVDKDVTISRGKNYITNQEDTGPKLSDLVLAHLRDQRVPFEENHPPIAVDYFDLKGVYLATCVYWRRRSNPPITESSRSLIERIQPFMVHALGTIRAKHHEDRNNMSFHSSLTRMAGSADLTSQECRVIALRILGHSYEEIAAKLSIARSTVHKHVLAVHRKTGTSSIVELFAKYFTPQENVTGVADSLAEGHHGSSGSPSPKR